MAGPAKKKKKVAEAAAEANPETTERKRLQNFAFSNNMLSDIPAKPNSLLSPSKMLIKHHGRDIVKKSQRKNRFLFSFPGLLAPIGGGKIGELKDLGSKNPILYIDFPQGRMKLFGTIVYPKNRYLTVQFPRGGKNVMCEDYFDNMIVFSDAWWIGSQADNPEEGRLDFPKELTDGQHAEYDFKGGAGGAACANKQGGHKTGITNREETPEPSTDDDLSEGENKDLMKSTPVRQSSRTAGKRFKFTEASSGDDSIASDADAEEHEEDKKDVTLDSTTRNYSSRKKENVGSVVFDIDSENEDDVEKTSPPSPTQNQGSDPSGTKSKKQSSVSSKKNKFGEESHGPLVQATISTLFKRVEEKTPRNSRKLSSPNGLMFPGSGQKAKCVDSKRKISQDEVPKKKAKVTNNKNAGKGVAKKEVSKVDEDEDDIEEFSSASQDSEESDEDWAA
ncbi:DNA-binding protein RHL1 isoform X2 [Humulus lupulus]|uniref:DNA-binding protein RHL1 isoform X2 n=1 Tax=Humulus lupulus TaxID=3486 RepID=UPI002B411F13|nr:DNA-binding protein RHL1 isoform X2 [Humulus lupulus]